MYQVALTASPVPFSIRFQGGLSVMRPGASEL